MSFGINLHMLFLIILNIRLSKSPFCPNDSIYFKLGYCFESWLNVIMVLVLQVLFCLASSKFVICYLSA